MTPIKALVSQPLTDYELLKLIRSANVITELVLQDRILIAVIKSLVDYSKALESRYDSFFKEARTSGVCEDLGSCVFL